MLLYVYETMVWWKSQSIWLHQYFSDGWVELTNKNQTKAVTFLIVGPEVWYLIIFHMFYNYKRKLRKSDVGSTTFPLRRRLGGETHVMCGVVLSFFGLCCWSHLGKITGFLKIGGSLVGLFLFTQHEPSCYFGLEVILLFWACPFRILLKKNTRASQATENARQKKQL